MTKTFGIILIALAVLLVIIVITVLIKKSSRQKRQYSKKLEVKEAVEQEITEKNTREHEKAQNTIYSRMAALGIIASMLIGVLAVRLWGMQVISSERYLKLSEENRTRKITSRAARGRILDRNGNVLVGNRPSIAVVGMRDVLDDTLLVKRVSNILGIPSAVTRRRLRDNSEGVAAPHTIAVDVPMDTVAYISERPDLFPGIQIENRTVRTYPNGKLAAHVLGYAGLVAEEELDTTNKEGIKYEMGDVVGKTGLESIYENVLQGVRGEEYVHVDAHGNIKGYTGKINSIPGNDVVTTIDIELQAVLEEALDHGISHARKAGHPNANAGAAVVIDPHSGEILAMASRPTFDPTVFVGGIGTSDWQALTDEKSDYPLTNRAISGQYPAASTIKGLSAIAGLEYGLVNENTGFNCPGFWTGFGKQWGKWCWYHPGHGYMTLRSGIAHSCNSVFYEVAKYFTESSTPDGLQETYRAWGLGDLTGIDLPSEGSGRIPDAKWKAEFFDYLPEQDRKWQKGDVANIVIGQGDLLVTPIQMLMAFCGIANNGEIMRPHLMKEVLAKDGTSPVVTFEKEVYLSPEVSESSLNLVQNGLKDVSGVSLSSLFSDYTFEIAGKTGTGQIAGKDNCGWYIGYIPADDPQYAVCVLLEQSGAGGGAAASTANKIVRYLMDRDKEKEEDENE